MPQHYQLSKLRLNLRPSTTAHADYAKYLLRILVLLKFIRISNRIHTNTNKYFFKKKIIFKRKLRHLDFFTQLDLNSSHKKIIIVITINF